MTLENIQFIVSLTTLIGFIIICYKTFRDPDIRTDKSIEVLKEQVKQEKEISKQAIKTMQNDLHTLGKQVEENCGEVKQLNISIAKLGTIIEERIPKKL